MESIVMLFVLVVSIVGALVAFDVAALTWGVDSRGPIADDHRR